MKAADRRPFRPLLASYGAVLPIIIVLGILSALSEAIGIGLFLPLLQPKTLADAGSSTHTNGALRSVLQALGAHRTSVLAAVILACLVLKAGITYVNGLLSARKSLQVGHELRGRVFEQLLNSGYSFVGQNEWGALLETLATETWRTVEALTAAVSLLTSACTILVFGAFLLLLSWPLTLGVGFGLAALSLGLSLVRRPVRRHGEEAAALNAKLGELMVDGILGVRTIESFNLQETMQRRFLEASGRVRAALLRMETWSALVNPCADISSSLLLLGLIVLSLNLGAEWPTLVVIVMVVTRLQTPFKQFETARVNWAALQGPVNRVFSLLESTKRPAGTRRGVGDPLPRRRFQSAIAFHDVSFVYPRSVRPSISHLSVEIPYRKVTAVVGLSGAGKTTFFNLICALHQPTSGEITIDGTPLRDIDPSEWRNHIALAGQDVYLFNTTVRENIRYGRLNATDAEIADAAQRANVLEFLNELPDGLDTTVGDNGGRLSGGQRQRIALARAFLRNPDILILDEATNALDSLSEHWIQSVLERSGRQCTILIAAHRFSTIQYADQVIVLDGGQLAQQGSPAALRREDGLFARLYELQSLTRT